MQKVTYWAAVLTAGFLGISAHSQLVPADVPLNNLITERVYNLGQPGLKNSPGDTNAPATAPLITDSSASLEFNYTYTRQWFLGPTITLPGGKTISDESVVKINSYNIAPSLFFVIRSNLMVTLGFDYLHQDISLSGNASQTYDDYTPFVCADAELLHFLPGVDASRNSLFLGGNFSYTRAIGSLSAPAPGLGYNDYIFGPSLVYIRSLIDWQDGAPGRASFTFNPAYSYNYNQSSFPPLVRFNSITVLGRVDFGITRNLYLNLNAAWAQYSYIGLPAHDAEFNFGYFGGGITAKLMDQANHLLLLRLGYTYQAFYTGVESHEVSAQLEYHF